MLYVYIRAFSAGALLTCAAECVVGVYVGGGRPRVCDANTRSASVSSKNKRGDNKAGATFFWGEGGERIFQNIRIVILFFFFFRSCRPIKRVQWWVKSFEISWAAWGYFFFKLCVLAETFGAVEETFRAEIYIGACCEMLILIHCNRVFHINLVRCI